MTGKGDRLRPSTRWSDHAPNTWGPYWDVLFGPGMVTSWTDWKRGSTGVNIVRRYWDQREYRRRIYESVYGSDPASWPSQHPGVALGDCAVCLRCHYFSLHSGQIGALDLAWRHESSGGRFRSHRPPQHGRS